MIEPPTVAALPHGPTGAITYTMSWSSETSVVVRPEPLLDGDLAIFTSGARGEGTALVNVPHVARQREVLLSGLCQVCARKLPPGRRLIVDLRIGRQTFRVDGKHNPLLVDGWTCEECLKFSLTGCPHLAALGPQRRVLSTTEWLFVPTPERPNWITSGLLKYGPVGYVKVVPMTYEKVDL